MDKHKNYNDKRFFTIFLLVGLSGCWLQETDYLHDPDAGADAGNERVVAGRSDWLGDNLLVESVYSDTELNTLDYGVWCHGSDTRTSIFDITSNVPIFTNASPYICDELVVDNGRNIHCQMLYCIKNEYNSCISGDFEFHFNLHIPQEESDMGSLSIRFDFLDWEGLYDSMPQCQLNYINTNVEIW